MARIPHFIEVDMQSRSIMAGAERRRAVRAAVSIDMQFRVDGVDMNGRVADISRGGMYIDTTYPLEPGARLGFRFVIPGTPGRTPVEGFAVVVWTTPMVGAGVRFLDLRADGSSRIWLFMQTQQARAA